MITGVAFRFGGKIVCSMPAPARHADLAKDLRWAYGPRTVFTATEEGFVTSRGQFLTRREAMVHVRRSKQLLPAWRGGYPGDELHSEQVW